MSPPFYAGVPSSPRDSGRNAFLLPQGAPKRHLSVHVWASTVWPLLAHFILTLGIIAFMNNYVDRNYFSPPEQGRRPLVGLADGTFVQWGQYVPLQTDVATILSSALVILRLIAAAWTGPLCWRSAFLLMEKAGLRRQDLKWITGFGIPAPQAFIKHTRLFVLGWILLASLVAQSASPILTGSISWTVSARASGLASNYTIRMPGPVDTDAWNFYLTDASYRRNIVFASAGVANTAWNRTVELGILKRAIFFIDGLHINSTLETVTLPYFSVTSLEWIADPARSLPPDQLDIINKVSPMLFSYEQTNRTIRCYPVLIPDAPGPWPSNLPLPSPTVKSETRTLVLHAGYTFTTCDAGRATYAYPLPPGIAPFRQGVNCYIFARVSYTAGVAVCAPCRVSSPLTVQNDSALALREDPLTTEALRLMPDVTDVLHIMDLSMPDRKTTMNLDEYVISVLERSYSGAWSGLTHWMGIKNAFNLSYSPSLQSLRAQVDQKRLFTWFALQFLITLSGVVFLFMAYRTEMPLIGDTTLTAFYLDTTEVPGCDEPDSIEGRGKLRLRSKNDGFKVAAEYPH
ncbi:hypothetical protein CTheo_7358 [Ceratobasidium theobromae]|uniref:Transmembrane protein n=1 Tax=Ceratobasidium theobromae TaxID=1582974 RepID=A0A5N5QBP6_9AGAM|nr:hypothetical protein CTheo_7358 [Ceratobasidium theobromae]